MSKENASTPPKLRHAEMITPPNEIKEKVGSGGIDETIINQAQKSIESNAIDFKPIAAGLLKMLDDSLKEAQSGSAKGEIAIESLLYPVMQLKAQGTMFHFSIITEVSNVLVNFLETISGLDKDVFEIIIAHKKALQSILSNNALKGDGGQIGKDIRDALMDACNRYYKTHQL